MSAPFSSLERQLKERILGEVRFDHATRQQFSTASCMYRIAPVGVVAPSSVDDVCTTISICRDNQVPIIARGGATGLVGQALGMGVILDFRSIMNNIVSISDDLTTATIQPGCTLKELNNALLPFGRYYPIDPQSQKDCTIGGTIATNASGAHGLHFGATKDQIQELEVASADTGVERIFSRGANRTRQTASVRFEKVKQLISSHHQLLESKSPNVRKTSSGYNLFDSIDSGELDPVRLLCGSEGTLGIFTEATVRLQPLPGISVAGLAYFVSNDAMAEATALALDFGPSAIELMDRTYINQGKGLSPIADELLIGNFQCILLIEFSNLNPDEAVDRLHTLKRQLEHRHLIQRWTTLGTQEKRDAFWNVREQVSEKLNYAPPPLQKISSFEDGAVSIENLPAFLQCTSSILEKLKIPYTLYGHAATGNIHCTPFVEIQTTEGRNRLDIATREIFDLIISLRGSLSGEHGDGYVRTPFLERAFGSDIYELFREVKEIFDPEQILNPGKIIGQQDGFFLHDLKY